jgi:hypothetical protein
MALITAISTVALAHTPKKDAAREMHLTDILFSFSVSMWSIELRLRSACVLDLKNGPTYNSGWADVRYAVRVQGIGAQDYLQTVRIAITVGIGVEGVRSCPSFFLVGEAVPV